MKKNIVLLLTVLAVVIFPGCQPHIAEQASNVPEVTGNIEIHIMQSGQADAIILTTENHSVIIDCGEEDDGDDIVKYLKENNINSVDYLFITHFDKDHVGGFPEVTENFNVGNVIVPDYEGSNKEYKKYLEAVSENNLEVTALTDDMSFILDDCLCEINPPQKKSYLEGDNDFSLVISLTHGDNKFLFAGDAEVERTKEILRTFKGEYDFLKVPHHGRYNSATKQLLASVKPEFAVITDSEKNPAEGKVLDSLNGIGCKTYQTKDGSVYISSDGERIEIYQ